jgi:hypothetical protein
MSDPLVTELYAKSWKQIIFGYTDRTGNLIPRTQRWQLYEYLTEGKIPTGFLLGILLRKFDMVFNDADMTSLERARISTIVDFVHEYLPLSMWNNMKNINSYSASIISRRLYALQKQYLDHRLQQQKSSVVVVD